MRKQKLTKEQKEDKLSKEIAQYFIQGLKKSKGKWVCPFKFGLPTSCASGELYNGFNRILLGMIMNLKGFTNPHFITFKGMRKLGGNIEKGTKTFPILKPVFAYHYETDKKGEVVKDDKGNKNLVTHGIRGFVGDRVFNIEQIKDLKPEIMKRFVVDKVKIAKPIDAELIIKGYDDKPEIKIVGTSAYYSPSADEICIPPDKNYISTGHKYSTLFHELAHSTGHHTRLDRKGVRDGMFGDKVYSFEELVAEISAVMLLSECGLVNDELKENSVEYVNGWVKQLEKRPEQILQAVQLSTKAVNYMKGKVKKK